MSGHVRLRMRRWCGRSSVAPRRVGTKARTWWCFPNTPGCCWHSWSPAETRSAEWPGSFGRRSGRNWLVKLSRPDKAVVLGTVPCLMPDGTLRNRAPILCGGRVLFQDKLNLTPWEDVFSGGDAIHLWRFKGATFAVLVCLDIEVPELAVALRGRGVDAILVPSATESLMGLERIGRCASARSVELCCYVGVAHLTGTAQSELVDKNVGRAAWFTPSQAAFEEAERVLTTQTAWEGCERQRGGMDLRRLARSRSARAETNPALLSAGLAQNLLVETVQIS